MKYICVCVLTLQIVLITLELEREMLGINSQTVNTVCRDGKVAVFASANMQLEARTGGGRAGHGLSVLGDRASIAFDESLGLLLEGVDRFFSGKIRSKEHETHGGIGVNPVDLLHRPGVCGIVDSKHAGPLDGAIDRLGLEEVGGEGEKSEGRGGELHGGNDM